MKDAKSRNRKSIAILAVIAIVIFSVIVDSRTNSLTKENNRLSKEIDRLVGKNFSFKEEVISGSNPKEKILVIPINGVIADNPASFLNEGYNHKHTIESLREASQNEDIKGIILSINSPGGTVYHSAQLWNAIKNFQEETDTPIYASMGTVAASGGYYVAAPADRIYAARETVTGSIGVIADYINYSGLEEKLGIKHNIMKSADHKDIGSASREMTEEEREILQSMIDNSYEDFLEVVMEGRGFSLDKALKIADGRIYDGRQALDNGLIDKLGYIGDAISDMTEDLGLNDPMVVESVANNLGSLSGLFNLNTRSREGDLDLIRELKSVYGTNNSSRLFYLYGGY